MRNIKRVAVAYLRELRNEELLWSLLQAGYDAQICETDISIYSIDKNDALAFADYIEQNTIDAFLTYDFCPALSDGCMIKGIPYIAWVYDCPLATLYENAISNDCNYIFSFDRIQVEKTKLLGAKHVSYQPLGTNMLRNSGTVITKEDEKRFSCDVSFVGNLLSDDVYQKAESIASDSVRQEYNKILDDAYGIWDGNDHIHNRISDKCLVELERIFGFESSGIKMTSDEFFTSNLLTYHLARMERIDMLQRLASYKINFFTGNNDVNIPGVITKSSINHIDELPKVYYLSKINLNITMHTILSGIPLRIFEIMGVGGFVLSNYQPEIEELFKIDKEIVVYHSLDEMEDKVKYYLKHEKQRLQICINGYNAVKNRFDNAKTIRRMIDVACLDH